MTNAAVTLVALSAILISSRTVITLTRRSAETKQLVSSSCEFHFKPQSHDISGNQSSVNDRLGFSLSMSQDGNVVAAGDPVNDKLLLVTRADKTYHWSAPTVVEGDEEGSPTAFGESVAVSLSLIAVGSTISLNAKGAVKLYSIQNVSLPFQRLSGQRAGVRHGDRFGHQIALDHSGHILVATAPSHSGVNNDQIKAGAMEVYHRTTHRDRQPFHLLQVIYGNAHDCLGEGGLDISNDGTMIAVSSPLATQPGFQFKYQGKVSIYQVLLNTVYLVQTIWGESSNGHLGLNDGVALSNTASRLAILSQTASHGSTVTFYDNLGISVPFIQIGTPLQGNDSSCKFKSRIRSFRYTSID